VEAGQRVATLRVSHEGKPLAEYAVIALESVAAAGFFAQNLGFGATVVQMRETK